MKKKMNNSSGGMKLFLFSASLAGLAAAYFFLSPKGKKNLENTKSWVIKMKGEVVEKLEQAREITESVYNEIIDSVATKYEGKKQVSSKEIKVLASDLKKNWRAIIRSAKEKESNDPKEKIRAVNIKK